MAGYARQSSSSIADGETITAAPLNSEFDAVLAAFAFSGGHNHDGSSTEGSYVGILADVDALNKVVVDTSNNRHGFFVQVSSSAVEQLRIQDGAIVPVTSNDIDLGTSSLQFKDIHIDGTAYVDTLEIHVGASLSAGVLSLPDGTASAPVITNTGDTNQGLYFSGTDEMSFTAGGTAQVTFADGVIKPVTDNDVDLGTSSLQFKDIHINGTANIDTLAGTTMSGNLAMGSNSITGLAAPSADGDAARKVYVDDAITNASNLTQLGGIINVNGYHFTGSSGEDIKFKPVGSASILSTQDTDGEFVGLVIRNESDAADTTGIASLRFDLEDTGGNTVDAAKIAVKKEASFTSTGASQDSSMVFSTSLNGTLTEYLKITSAGILEPITDDTVDIGTATKEIKNIYVDGTAYIDAIGFGTTSVTLPGTDGTANQILKTNGSGTISWAADSGASGAQTAITSVLNTSLVVGRDSDNDIDFATDNTILFRAGAADQIKLIDGALLPVTDADIDLGSSSLQFKDAFIHGTLEADAITINGTTLAVTIEDTAGALFSGNTETGITATYQAADNTIDLAINAAQTTVTSLLATDIKIGEDNETKIDFETVNEIHLYANNAEQVYVADGIFGPETDSDVDLGTTGVRWKDAFIDTVTTTGALTVGGDLTVNGTTTTVNSTTVTVDDPIFTLGGDGNASNDDNKDRGIEFKWHTGSAAKVGFFGYDDSAGAFTFVPDATNSSEVFSGTVGNAIFGNITGTLQTAAQTNITSTGALGGGSIAAGFGAIDNGTSGIRTNIFTAETSVVPDASGGADLGTTSLEWGNLYIADDKKIALGSDQNFTIEYDEDGNDTTAVVAATGLSLAPHGTSAGNGTELRFQELAANGAHYVGFKAPDSVAANKVFILPNADGSADQVLKTDGSLALDWVDQAGGGTVDRVADGAIAIRKPVVLTSAGKAQQVAETTTSSTNTSPTAKAVTDIDGTGGDRARNAWTQSTYEATSGTYVVVFSDTSNSNYPSIVAGTWSNGTVTWGTPVAISGNSIDSYPVITSGDGRVYVLYRLSSSGDIYMYVGTISGTSFTQTANGAIQGSATSGAGLKIEYSPTQDQVFMVYSRDNSGSKTYARSASINANGSVNTISSELQLEATNAHASKGSLIYDPDTDRAMYATFNGAQGDDGYAWVLQASGTAGSPTIAAGTGTKWNGNDNVNYVSGCYDTENNKTFLAFRDGGGTVRGVIASINSGTNAVTFAGEADIWDCNDSGGNYFEVAFDEDTNKIIFLYRDDDNSDYTTYKIITPSASSFSVANGAVISSSDNRMNTGSGSGAAGKGVLFSIGDAGDSNKIAYTTTFFGTTSSATTSLDNGNYLGVSAAAISDGATGKIVIPGGLSEGHSSLTIEDHYYTNGAGAVGKTGNATGEHYLGKAISATEILLTKEQDNYIHATANGAITVGKGVIINSSGDAEAISATGNVEWVVGTKTDLNHNGMAGISTLLYDTSSDKYFMSIPGAGTVNNGLDSPKLSAYVFTQASDGSLTVTNPVEIAANGDSVRSAYDASTGMIVTIYRDKANSNYGTMVIGAISGTTYSKGTAVVFASDNLGDVTSVAAGGGRALVLFKDSGGNLFVASRLGVITAGNKSVAFQDEVTVDDTSSISTSSVSYDATQGKFLLAWQRAGSTNPGVRVVVGSLSGNTISYGTPVYISGNVANNDTFSNPRLAFDSSSGKHLLVYSEPQGTGFDNTIRANVATISGTDVSLGTFVDVGGKMPSSAATLVPEGNNVITLMYSDTANSNLETLKRGTISGTDITFATAKILEDGRATGGKGSLAYNPDLGRYMAHTYGSDDGDNDIYPLKATSPNSEDFVGIATKTVADDEQAEIVVMGGEQSGYTGLTAGSDVYVGTDGTISSTAASPSVVAGKALSANKILIKA